jgi:hypothetical protein
LLSLSADQPGCKSARSFNGTDGGAPRADALSIIGELRVGTDTQFLVLARDSGNGFSDPTSTSAYRSVDLIDISHATNLAGDKGSPSFTLRYGTLAAAPLATREVLDARMLEEKIVGAARSGAFLTLTVDQMDVR